MSRMLVGLLAAMLAGCAAAPPKPAEAKMQIVAAADVNPDGKGRPSPIVIRIYQLKTEAEFAGADFFAIYDREKEILGPALITREEYTLDPGETEDIKFEVNRDARFLGVLAGYRDPSARWRAMSPAPEKGLADLIKKDRVSVSLGKNAVTLAIKD
ncbi:MAG TPA: type VI secretion system lipoprotein TssJ [Steroidobacteraceae bacterium]|nr:type VI secretion system lipoprotein TssJ [Steroidobacteraceae bacterium]